MKQLEYTYCPITHEVKVVGPPLETGKMEKFWKSNLWLNLIART